MRLKTRKQIKQSAEMYQRLTIQLEEDLSSSYHEWMYLIRMNSGWNHLEYFIYEVLSNE